MSLSPTDQIPLPPHTIVIYTDGGASPNPGHAGLGVCMLYNQHVLELWEYLGKTSNNVAELTAIQRALENLKVQDKNILLYSDSAYAIGVLSKRMKAKKNIELIEKIQNLIRNFPKLQLLKVKAHIGITLNERVDKLVERARESKSSGQWRGTLDDLPSLKKDKSSSP